MLDATRQPSEVSQAPFAINPVIELSPINGPGEHVKAVLQHEPRPGRGLDGRVLQGLASELFGELLGEPKPIRAGERSDRFQDVAHAVHVPTLARLGLPSIQNYRSRSQPIDCRPSVDGSSGFDVLDSSPDRAVQALSFLVIEEVTAANENIGVCHSLEPRRQVCLRQEWGGSETPRQSRTMTEPPPPSAACVAA
jgi:hypothetical protein